MDTENRNFARLKSDLGVNPTLPGPNSEKNYSLPRLSVNYSKVLKTVLSGSVTDKRKISRDLYNSGSIYTHIIEYYATMPDFNYFCSSVKYKEKATLKNIAKVLDFADGLKPVSTFTNILRNELIDGCYYGVLCYDKIANYSYIIEVPHEDVRVIGEYSPGMKAFAISKDFFKNKTEEELLLILSNLPQYMVESIKKGDNFIIVPAYCSVSFEMPGGLPPFLFAIVSFFDYLDRLNMDKKRMEQELLKILVQKLPIKNDGELIFTLDEAAELHENLANLLRNNKLANAITTFGSVESVSTDSQNQQSRLPISDFLKLVPVSAGLISSIFYPQSANDSKISIQKDSAYVLKIVEDFNNWLLYQARFINKDLTLRFLPTTWANREAYRKEIKETFDYGFNKILYGVTLGNKQSELLSQISLENELNLNDVLKPIQNANTISSQQSKDIETKPEQNLQKNDKMAEPSVQDE